MDLPERRDIFFVYLNGDRLYTEKGTNLYVYALSNLSSPIASYPLGNRCYSGIITENRVYLGGRKKLHIFEVTDSITQPLILVKVIATESEINKILREAHDLLLGQDSGFLEVFDIKTSTITSSH